MAISEATSGLTRAPAQGSFYFLLFLILCMVGAHQPSWATPHVQDRLNSLKMPEIRWQSHQSMELFNVPAYVAPFTSIAPASIAAQRLGAHAELFQRVLAVKNKIVLSGVDADWHWLAEINATPSGAAGYVSALRLADAEPIVSVPAPVAKSEFRWLPPGAQRRFSQRTVLNGRPVSQYIYSLRRQSTAGEFTAYVSEQLRSHGWRAEKHNASASTASIWRRQNDRLILMPLSSGPDDVLYVQHFQ